jgi:hypothetical protein
VRNDPHPAKLRDAVPKLGVGAGEEAQILGHVELAAEELNDGGREGGLHAAEGDLDGRVHPVDCCVCVCVCVCGCC